jgi:Tol biopolymer transport system component
MTTAITRAIGLAAAVVLLLGALAPGLGETLAQGSLKQLTTSTDNWDTHPSISADGSRIAFWWKGEEDIYVINSDGTGLRRLTTNAHPALEPPSISADGLWVAFTSNNDVYLAQTSGAVLRQLTRAPTCPKCSDGYKGQAVISGDGSLVVFVSTGNLTGQNGDNSAEIFAVKSDGTGLRQITNFVNVPALNAGDISTTWTASAPTIDYQGTRVAFFLEKEQRLRTTASSVPAGYDLSLYVVNTDGSGLRKLSLVSDGSTSSGSPIFGQKPAISGDGTRVAFTAPANLGGGNPEGNIELFTIKTDGTGLVQLTSQPSNWVGFPSLTYDGSRIAFMQCIDRPRGLTYEVYIINADGTGRTQLTRTEISNMVGHSGDEGVAMSADGSHVAFSSNGDFVGKNPDHNYVLYLLRLTALLPVQGVRNQSMADDLKANRYSLVARRDLVVRAFFDTGAGGPSAPAQGTLVVDEGKPGERTFQVADYTARPQGYFDDKTLDRVLLENSLNFFITGQTANDLLTPGLHTFKVRVEPKVAGAFAPWEETFQANFREPDSMDIFIIPVRIKNAAGQWVSPDAGLLAHAADLLRATYPVDEEKVHTIRLAPEELNQAPNTAAKIVRLLRQLQARRIAQLLVGWVSGTVANPARRNFAAGVVPYQVDGQPALGESASGIRAGATATSIPDVVVSLDRHPSSTHPPLIGSTIAHEVGHTLGLGDEYDGGYVSPNNPPPPKDANGKVDPNYGTVKGNYVRESDGGLDTAHRFAVFNRLTDEYLGFMGGGDDLNSWGTTVEYHHIYTQVTTDTVGVHRVAAAAPTRFINVSGVISRTGGIQLDPFLVATSPYTFTRPSGTQYSFQFRDSNGSVLDTVGFDVDFSEEALGAGYVSLDEAPFSFTVPLPDGVSSMVVLTGTTPVITYTVSPQPPTVTVLTPNGGETLRGQSQVSWQASDPDGDALTYTVIYSPNGTDRYVVATGLTTTTLA